MNIGFSFQPQPVLHTTSVELSHVKIITKIERLSFKNILPKHDEISFHKVQHKGLQFFNMVPASSSDLAFLSIVPVHS